MNKFLCKTCNNSFEGNYCNECGEKKIFEEDFSIKNIISQAFKTVTNLDSKLFLTLKFLFFYPGKLTNKFVQGVRVPYMKPFQLFLIANVIFFFFLSKIDIFRTPSKWFFIENFDGIKVMKKVREISEQNGYEISEIASMYDLKSEILAKALIVFLIPFIALIGKILYPKHEIQFGKHIVFATHYFSFILLICVLISQILIILPIEPNRWFFIIPITFFITIYYVIGTKNFYKTKWLNAIIKGILGVILINILIHFYKMTINLITIYNI